LFLHENGIGKPACVFSSILLLLLLLLRMFGITIGSWMQFSWNVSWQKWLAWVFPICAEWLLCINFGGLTTNSLLSRDWKNSEKKHPKKYSKLMKKCPMSHPLCANCWPLTKHDDEKNAADFLCFNEKKRKYYHRWEKWALISIAVKCEIKENLLNLSNSFLFLFCCKKNEKKNDQTYGTTYFFPRKKFELKMKKAHFFWYSPEAEVTSWSSFFWSVSSWNGKKLLLNTPFLMTPLM